MVIRGDGSNYMLNILRMNAHLERLAKAAEERGDLAKAEAFRRATVPEFMIPLR